LGSRASSSRCAPREWTSERRRGSVGGLRRITPWQKQTILAFFIGLPESKVPFGTLPNDKVLPVAEKNVFLRIVELSELAVYMGFSDRFPEPPGLTINI